MPAAAIRAPWLNNANNTAPESAQPVDQQAQLESAKQYAGAKAPELAPAAASASRAKAGPSLQTAIDTHMTKTPNSSPRDFGGMVSNALQGAGSRVSNIVNGATQAWKNMPASAQAATAIGVPAGLAGLYGALNSNSTSGAVGGGLMAALGLGAAGLSAAGTGAFGDTARQAVGRGAMGLAGFLGQNVPSAETLNAGNGAAQKEVMDAMMAQNEAGTYGGWAAGQKTINGYRDKLSPLMGLGREYGTTALMGLPGEGAPQTSEAAGKLYDELSGHYTNLQNPDFLRQQVSDAATKRVADSTLLNNPISRTVSDWSGGGGTPEAMAQSWVQKNFGDYPAAQKAAADKVIYKILAASAVRRATARAYA